MSDAITTRHEKLNYILNEFVSAADVTHAFGFKSESMLSRMRNNQTNITTLHLDGLEKYFNIPIEVFNEEITTKEEIKKLIEAFQLKGSIELTESQLYESSHIAHRIFPKNSPLLEKLKGIWYGYLYPSNPSSAKHGIWEVKTIIGEDYSVIDEPWGNSGYLKIGKNQSLIIKESHDNEDLTLIRFTNRQVHSGIFRFVIVSNQNNTIHEMVNFGFFSRKQYSPDEAKEILGDPKSKQLKLDLEFNNRLIARSVVPQ